MCLQQGRVTPATVADHIKPHRGDWMAFRLGNLQSLCASCHNGAKRALERGLTLKPKVSYGIDGWPVAS
jgi:5-methylcytosine-specific restriction endonuclease McrA